MANAAADIFRRAAEMNRNDPRRHGNVITLDDELDIVVAGDIHGYREALSRVISYADLARQPDRQLILQEIVHGPLDTRTGQDRIVEVLLRAARLKLAFEENVIFLLANHDLAQATGNEIAKQGVGVCRAFDAGVRFCFGDDADEVLDAVSEFCCSSTLAVRTPNGVWMSHSLPSPERMEMEDLAILDVLDRPYTESDFRRGGGAYEWTWGRDQTEEQTDLLASQLRVEYFVLGHRHLDLGCEMITPRAIAIASNHRHGCIVHFNTNRVLTADTILDYVRPIISLEQTS